MRAMASRSNAKTARKRSSSRQSKSKADSKVTRVKSTAKNVSEQDARFIEKNKGELSRTTQRAKWIYSPDEREDRPGQSLATRVHEVIQAWAEERGAKPATVPSTRHGDRLGVLRFDFPDFGGRKLEEVSWDDWFKTFDERDLVFVFQHHKADGSQSNFFRFDSPHREEA